MCNRAIRQRKGLKTLITFFILCINLVQHSREGLRMKVFLKREPILRKYFNIALKFALVNT